MAVIQGVPEQQVVNYVVTKWDDFKMARSGKEAIWRECMDMYMSRFTPALAEWLKKNQRSSRYVGLPWDAVETVYAQIMAQLFPGDQWLKLRPSEPGGFDYDDKSARAVQQLIYQQHRMSNFRQSFGNGCVKQLILFGSAPFTSSWDIQWTTDFPKYAEAMQEYDTQNKAAWEEFQAQYGQFQAQMQALVAAGADPAMLPQEVPFTVPPPPTPDQKIAYQGPRLECDDIFNFVIDPYPNRPEGALRIKRAFKTLAYLKKFAEPDESGYAAYQNLEQITEIDLLGSKTATDGQLAARAAAFGLNIPKLAKGVELLEAQGDMEIPLGEGSGLHLFMNYTATVANSKTLIRFEPGFLWIGEPATQLATICNPPGEVYGTGMLEPSRGTNEVIQARTNQLIDGVAAAINPEYKCVDDGIIDINAVSAPGKKHLMANVDNMQPIQKNLAGIHAAMQDYALLKAEFQQLARANNPSVPMYQRSATEIAQSGGVMGATLTQIVREIEQGPLTRLIQHQLCMNAMYITEPVMAYATQQDPSGWMPVSPQDTRRGWLVAVMGSQHIAERSQRIQDRMFFAQMTGGNPVYAPFIRHLTLLKQIAGDMFNEIDDLFVDEKTGQALLIEMMVNGTLAGTGSAGGGSSNAGSSQGSGSGAGNNGQPDGGAADPAGGTGAWISDAPEIPVEGLLAALPGMRP